MKKLLGVVWPMMAAVLLMALLTASASATPPAVEFAVDGTIKAIPDAKTGVIEGRIVDEMGKPVGAATVMLDSPPRTDAPQKRLATVETDRHGMFRIDSVPPDIGYVIAGETKDRRGAKNAIDVKAGTLTDIGPLVIKPGPRF